MKHIPVIFLLFFSSVVFGQVHIIVKPTDTIVCYHDSVAFVSVILGNVTGKVTYKWQRNSHDIPGGAPDSLYAVKKVDTNYTGRYHCILFVNDVPVDTSGEATLRMHPKMKIDSFYRYNQLGCFTDCKAQYKVKVSGGTPYSIYPPYIYEWNGGKSQDTLVFGLCPGKRLFKVTDSLGCMLDTNYVVDALKSPKIEITFAPHDTIYLSNPTVTVSFPDSMRKHLTNWTWDFGDSTKIPNLNPSTHLYTKSGEMNIKLLTTNTNGCDSTYEKTLTIKVAKLKIPNVFTPNGDYINDKFEVQLEGEGKNRDYREAYLSTEFSAYDRWGRKVFSATNYKSEDWDGDHLADGTYYYILKCTGQWSDDIVHGSVTIMR